jgi:hypothetical protein
MSKLSLWEIEGEKSSLKRPRRRWEYNIKMDVMKIGCGYKN